MPAADLALLHERLLAIAEDAEAIQTELDRVPGLGGASGAAGYECEEIARAAKSAARRLAKRDTSGTISTHG